MDASTRAAMAATGDLGEQVKDHLIQTLALVNELKAARKSARMMADENFEAGMEHETLLALAQVAHYDTLIAILQTNDH